MLPFECILDGPPVSQQTRRRERLHAWKLFVRQQAELRWDGATPPTSEYVQIRVTYFHEAVSMDVDNIVKPIQDALVGLVYVDDEQVTDIVVRKRHINNAFTSEHMSPILIEGFTRRNQFLHVVVALAPNQENLDQ